MYKTQSIQYALHVVYYYYFCCIEISVLRLTDIVYYTQFARCFARGHHLGVSNRLHSRWSCLTCVCLILERNKRCIAKKNVQMK